MMIIFLSVMLAFPISHYTQNIHFIKAAGILYMAIGFMALVMCIFSVGYILYYYGR